MAFCFIAFLKERICVEKLGRMKNGLVSSCSSLHTNNAENPTFVLPSKQRLHKLCFLRKLGCQKPCWDQARLSSLVNKQVDTNDDDNEDDNENNNAEYKEDDNADDNDDDNADDNDDNSDDDHEDDSDDDHEDAPAPGQDSHQPARGLWVGGVPQTTVVGLGDTGH